MNPAQQKDSHLGAGDRPFRAVFEGMDATASGDACIVQTLDKGPGPVENRNITEYRWVLERLDDHFDSLSSGWRDAAI
jgi:hypothetical protein